MTEPFQKKYPKILILGETFRYNGGGGITLINLFRDWDKDCLAIATEKIFETTFNANCKKFYRLGHLERRIPFPFNTPKRLQSSGEITISGDKNGSVPVKVRTRLRIKLFVESLYYHFLEFLGLRSFFDKLEVSDQLLAWVNEYKPDVLYSLPFHHRDMVFSRELAVRTGIPLVIHIMDDSVSFQNKPNLLYYYWKKRIEKDFEALVKTSTYCLSISDAMADEYFRRYHKEFSAFRNPIEIEVWSPTIRNDWAIHKPARIIYTGRLAVPNIDSLKLISRAIHSLNQEEIQVNLDIYSIDKDPSFEQFAQKLRGIRVYPPVPYSQIPEKLSGYDIALLPFDFSAKGKSYARYSISTKTSEYMISGIPILLVAPEDIASTSYARDHQCMHIITSEDPAVIKAGITQLIENQALREQIARQAISTAKHDSDARTVRARFRQVFDKVVDTSRGPIRMCSL